MRKYFLYKLTFPNSKVYIGQTVNFRVRMRGHKNDSFNPNRMSRNCQVNNAIRKYGWENVKRKIILTCDESQIDMFEREYIKLYKSTDRRYGYNRENGGNRKKIVSVESRKLISKSRSGRVQWSKPVFQIEPETNKVIKEWESMREASRRLSIPQSNISMACNKKKKKIIYNGKDYFINVKTVGGFKWLFPHQVLTIA